MSSSALIRQLPKLTTSTTIRSFSVAARRMNPESGRGDAFNKREEAAENLYVRQQEKAKLEALKKKIADKEADLAKDRKELEDASKK